MLDREEIEKLAKKCLGGCEIVNIIPGVVNNEYKVLYKKDDQMTTCIVYVDNKPIQDEIICSHFSSQPLGVSKLPPSEPKHLYVHVDVVNKKVQVYNVWREQHHAPNHVRYAPIYSEPLDSTIVALVSGGLDSSVMVHKLLAEGNKVLLLFIDQNTSLVEMKAFYRLCSTVGDNSNFVGYSIMTNRMSFLEYPVIFSDTSEELYRRYRACGLITMVVSAAVFACSRGYKNIALAVHRDDHHFVNISSASDFVTGIQALLHVCGLDVRIIAPFVDLYKHEILKLGVQYGVKFQDTYSCISKPPKETAHCGKCVACVDRKQAFKVAGLEDPTNYKGGE